MILNQFIDQGTDALVFETLQKSVITYPVDAFEKRTLKISGHPALLDKIEAMLGYMSMLGDIGHSTEFRVGVDGDGGFSCRCKDEKGKELKKKHSNWIEQHSNADGDIDHFSFD